MITSLDAPVLTRDDLFKPINPDFTNFEVHPRDSFRWAEILKYLGVPVGKYVVLYVFRSIKHEDVDSEILATLDDKALLAAEGAEGFIHYQPFDGLSYCLWESNEDARAATSSPEHREAARYATLAYERWELLCWKISRTATTDEVEFIEQDFRTAA